MVLDISVESVMSLLTVISLLVVYSILDIRDREVKNELVIAGGAIGGIVLILTGHIALSLVLHLTGLLLAIPIAYILFRLGSIGGADAKVLFVVAFVSPGIELGILTQPLLEAIIGLGGELIVMLLGGYIYWRVRRNEENAIPPLIPFLFLGYLMIQVFALI